MRVLVLLWMILCIQPGAFAETIFLKTGKTIEGTIVESNDKYIKVTTPSLSIPLTYYRDDIERISGGANEIPPKDEKSVTNGAQNPLSVAAKEEKHDIAMQDKKTFADDLLPFQLGFQKVGPNDIEFKFPSDGGTLFAYCTKEWHTDWTSEMKLIIKLYDKNKTMLQRSESLCASNKTRLFSPIAFSVTKQASADIAFFSVSVESCIKKDSASLDLSRPEVVFARRVESAIKESQSAFSVLFSTRSEKTSRVEKFIYENLHALISAGGKIVSVVPLEGKEAEKYIAVCPRPYSIEIEQVTSSGIESFSIPIGEVGGRWRVLTVPETK